MTIKDIAKECGCAIGTVSRVLNGHPDVSDATRAKVMEVVDKYGFVLNQNAKHLKEQQPNTIAIFVKGASSILLNNMLEIIQHKLEGLPYNVSVVVMDEYDDESKRAVRYYYEQTPIGMVFLGGNPERKKDEFSKIKIPVVLISTQAEEVDNELLSSVSTDDLCAAEYSAEYLIKMGHKKIGVIGGDLKGSEMSMRRYTGFIEALDNANIPFDFNKSYVTAKYSFEGGAEAAKKLIEKNPDITAVFTMADVQAIGACRKLKEMGYSIPDDISIIGFDGLPIAQYYCPSITTIKQTTDKLAQTGIDILLDCVEHKAKAVHKLIPFEFVNGESVRKI